MYQTHRGTAELYDLGKDPGEREDVAARHPAVVKELTAALQRAAQRCGGPAGERDDDDERRGRRQGERGLAAREEAAVCDKRDDDRQRQRREQRAFAWTRKRAGDRPRSSRLSPARVYLTFQT